MKIKDIRSIAQSDLRVKATDLAEELFKLQFQHSIRPLENPARLKQLRKDIARIKTVISERSKAE